MNPTNYITPNWDAPEHIRAFTTTKRIELADIEADLGLENPLTWLTQVHGNGLYHTLEPDDSKPVADGSYTTSENRPCVVRTADCLPVLLTNRAGSFVAALHCGWKGLHLNLIQKAVDITDKSSELIAWIGPGISQKNYEVDTHFFTRFCAKDAAYAGAFQTTGKKYRANLPRIAEHQLQQAGVQSIFQSGICSFDAADDCHSFRRDGEQSGRMATLIWIETL